jgi:hypothetical protein
MRSVTCRCEKAFDADLPDEIDLDAEPRLIDQILSGDFFAVTCPNCGSRLKPELRVRILSRKRSLDLTVIPELERMSYYRGTVEIPKGGQVLIGYDELYERARILRDNIDPEAVEIIKYWLAAKAAEQAPEAEIVIAYAGFKDGKLTFHVSGLREGEIAVLPVDEALYKKTLAEKARSMRSDPFDRIFAGAYKSIRALEAEPEATE